MFKARKTTGIEIMVAQNTWTNLMFGVRAHEFYFTPLPCTIMGSTTNPAKCGKTPVNGVKAPGNGVKSPGNADESREFPGLLC